MLNDLLSAKPGLDEKEFSRDSRGVYIRPEKHTKGNNASARVAKNSTLSFVQMLQKNFSISTSDTENRVSEIRRQRHMKRNEPFFPLAENYTVQVKTDHNDGSCSFENIAKGSHDEALSPKSLGSGLHKLLITRVLRSVTNGHDEGVNKITDGSSKDASVESYGFYMNGEISPRSAFPSLAGNEDIKSQGLQNNQGRDRLLQIVKDVLRAHGYKDQSIEKIAEGFEKAVYANFTEFVFGMDDIIPLGDAIPGKGNNLAQTTFTHQAGPVSINMGRGDRPENEGSLFVFSSAQGSGEEWGGVVGDFKSSANITLQGNKPDVIGGILFDVLMSKGFDEGEANNILADVRAASKLVFVIGDAVQKQYDVNKLSSITANQNLNNLEHDMQATLMNETDGFLEKQFSGKVSIASPNNLSEAAADGGTVADKDQKTAWEKYGMGLNLLNADSSNDYDNYHRDDYDGLMNKNNGYQYSLILKNRETRVKAFSGDMALEMDFFRRGKESDDEIINKSKPASGIHGAFDIPGMVAGDKLQKIESNSPVAVNALIEQVADKLSMALNKGGGRVLINLAPPHLGGIDIDIMVRESRVQVLLTSGNRDVQQVLQLHADRLRDALQQHGIQVESFDVLHNENYSYHEGQFGWGGLFRQEESRGRDNRKNSMASSSLPEVFPITNSPKRQELGDGISVFV